MERFNIMRAAKNKYSHWVAELKQNIQLAKMQTTLQVNKQMLVLYWYLGKQIEEKITKENWGTKIIEQLSDDLQKSFPDLKGFSIRNLSYMQQFAIAYPDLLILQQPVAKLKNSKKLITQQAAAEIKSKQNVILQQPVAELNQQKYFISNVEVVSIPWGHHTFIIDKITNQEERIWYIKKTIENSWSRSVLQYQIETDLYQRQHKTKKVTNFHLTLPKAHSDLANQLMKDPYIFNFISLGEKISERELENTLMKHVEEFLIELSAGFAFVGRQVKLKIGNTLYKADLLFYHLHLRSYIVIDLKMNEFELSHTGQMNGYLNYVNKKYKQAHDNPSIGIILCGSKDNVEANFALQSINHPIGVSEYTFSKSLPKQYRNLLPSAKQLQDEVKKFFKSKKIK
jgi:predicted nuclease of restriction endonuclease-like (RecB) superfamily